MIYSDPQGNRALGKQSLLYDQYNTLCLEWRVAQLTGGSTLTNNDVSEFVGMKVTRMEVWE